MESVMILMGLLNNHQKLLFLLYSSKNYQLSMKEVQNKLNRSVQQISRMTKKLYSRGFLMKEKIGLYGILQLTEKGQEEVKSIRSYFNNLESKQKIPLLDLKNSFKNTLSFLEDYFPKDKINSLLNSLLDDVELSIS